MTSVPLSDRQIKLLRVVTEGVGRWDARRIDITFSSRYGAGETTTLQQLEELERLGLLCRDINSGGVGGRWKLTSKGKSHIE